MGDGKPKGLRRHARTHPRRTFTAGQHRGEQPLGVNATRRAQAAGERGHAALLATFAAQVDPDGVMPEHERERLARNAYAAHMKRLALASSKARRTRGEAA